VTAPAQEREQLRAALRGVDDFLAERLARRGTEVEQLDTPYLRTYRIYEVVTATPHGSAAWFVGYAPGAPVHVLDGTPSAFVRLAQADRTTIGSAALAVAYATAYLEFVRSPRELFYLVRSVDDVRFVPDPSRAERRAIERLRSTYATTIAPPHAEQTPDGHRVVAYVMRQRALERHVVEVAPDASVTSRSEVLAPDAPVVYGA
jgi:hypothetical protein